MALKDIIGQERALRILRGTLKRTRVPSAMLFSGDTGIGKRYAALSYAKAVNCLQPSGVDCCDVCSSCRKIDAGIHPDVTVLIPEGEGIKIEAVRKLEELLFLSPYEGKKKVVIMDDADAMNINAANAFLKTLEEPPQDSLILLLSSNPDGLPDTIRSRCTQVRFYPLSLEGCRKIIGGRVAEKDLDTVLGLAMGRPGLALSRDLMAEKEWFSGLLEAMVRGEARDVWEDKNATRAWIDTALVFMRDLAVHAVTGSDYGLLYGGAKQWTAAGRKKNEDALLRAVFDAYQCLLTIRGLLDFNLNKSISWNYVSAVMRQVQAVCNA
jgi:DNA polymerase-3 subunit delta'